MNQPKLEGPLKTAILAVFVLLLTLSAFGLGVNVGARYPFGFSAGSARAAVAVADQAGSHTPAADDQIIDSALFKEAWDLLQRQFYGDLPSGKEITYDAIRGLVDHLGDKHTAFLDPKLAASQNEMMEGHFEGIGAQVSLAEGGGVLIEYLYPGQPAEQAGLRIGDVITLVDGKDVSGLGLTEAIALIRGPEGTDVRLTIKRGDASPAEVTVTRARIEIPVVKQETLADGRIAYVALSEFTAVAPGRLAETLQEVVASRPAGIIFDLRGNPGGFLDAAVRIGSYFVPEGEIVTERFKDGTEHIYQREGSYMLDKIPLVVLVDGGSASAAEIVAGAIQDSGMGILIGEKTYGKGSVQLVNALSDGSQLRITVAHWFTPKGRGIHESGLVPDLAVPLTEEDAAAKRDPQLDRAVRYLLGDRSSPATPAPGGATLPLPAVPTPVPPGYQWRW